MSINGTIRLVICASSVSILPADHLRSISSTYMFPFDEDFVVYDFEVEPEDEELCPFSPLAILAGKKLDNGVREQLPIGGYP
jgi:hypothetical protein